MEPWQSWLVSALLIVATSYYYIHVRPAVQRPHIAKATGTAQPARESGRTKIKKSSEHASRRKTNAVGQAPKQDTSFLDADVDSPSENDVQSVSSGSRGPALSNGFAMLQEREPAPKTLRLTEAGMQRSTPSRSKADTPEAGETKKQRQNRKKREAQRMLRDEAEIERKQAYHQQKRVVQAAELGDTKKPASQAWEATSASRRPLPAMLDTNEDDPRPLPAGQSPLQTSEADNAVWSTVSKRPRGKKKEAESGLEKSVTDGARDLHDQKHYDSVSSESSAKPTAARPASTIISRPSNPHIGHPDDSEWVVT